jgi:hypothetical protein
VVWLGLGVNGRYSVIVTPGARLRGKRSSRRNTCDPEIASSRSQIGFYEREERRGENSDDVCVTI